MAIIDWHEVKWSEEQMKKLFCGGWEGGWMGKNQYKWTFHEHKQETKSSNLSIYEILYIAKVEVSPDWRIISSLESHL